MNKLLKVVGEKGTLVKMTGTSRRAVRQSLQKRKARLAKGVWITPRTIQKLVAENLDDNKKGATARLVGMAQYLWDIALGSVVVGQAAVHLESSDGGRFSLHLAVSELRQVMIDIEPWFGQLNPVKSIELKEPPKETIADFLYGRDGNRCVFLADEAIKSNPKFTLGEFKAELESALGDLEGDAAVIIGAALRKEDGDDYGWHDSHDEQLQWEIEACLGVLEEVIEEYGEQALITDEFKYE